MATKADSNQLELWDSSSSTTQRAQDSLFSDLELGVGSGGNPRPTPESTTRLLDRNFATRRPLNILVADDNEINRKVIRVILQKLGYQCVEAMNGEEALEQYNSGKYDYIFMDIDMPEMTGIEATQAIRRIEEASSEKQTNRIAEIIAVTANISNETRLECKRAGMNGYLEKPITASDIKDQLLRSWPRVRNRRKT